MLSQRNFDVVSKAREYIGTPAVHQGRVKGVGIDCVGLIVCVGRECGALITEAIPCYKRIIRNRIVEKLLAEQFDVCNILTPGSVVVLGNPVKMIGHHLGVYTGPTIIHASGAAKHIVETVFESPLKEKFISAWSYRWL